MTRSELETMLNRLIAEADDRKETEALNLLARAKEILLAT